MFNVCSYSVEARIVFSAESYLILEQRLFRCMCTEISLYYCLLDVQCMNSSCLVELAEQLAVIMIGKQIINNAQELLVP